MFNNGKLFVKGSFQGVRYGNQSNKMCPCQLSYQWYDNLFIVIYCGKLHHSPQIFLCKRCSEFFRQLSGYCRNNLFPVFGPFALKYKGVDLSAYMPIQER